MPHLIAVPVRQVIVQRAQQGQSAGLIARCLGLVPRTVRQLLQRLRIADAYRDDALPAGSLPFRMALAFRNSARRRVSHGFS